VPLLVRHERFELAIQTALDGDDRTLRFAPPIWLPATVRPMRTISIAERLARDLEAMGCVVERDPSPLEVTADGERVLLFADLCVMGSRIEVLGFATADYVAHKRARYRAAGVANVVLCVDRERSAISDDDSLVAYRRRVEAARVLAIVRAR
jgi:hypothetical protein